MDHLDEFERRLEQQVDRRGVRQRIRRRRRLYRIAAVSLVAGVILAFAAVAAILIFFLSPG